MGLFFVFRSGRLVYVEFGLFGCFSFGVWKMILEKKTCKVFGKKFTLYACWDLSGTSIYEAEENEEGLHFLEGIEVTSDYAVERAFVDVVKLAVRDEIMAQFEGQRNEEEKK